MNVSSGMHQGIGITTNTIIYNYRYRSNPVTHYQVCRTACWRNNLLPYVERQLAGQDKLSSANVTTAIHAAVMSWLVRYKYRIFVIPLESLDDALNSGYNPREDGKTDVVNKVDILCRDLEEYLDLSGKTDSPELKSGEDEHIRNFHGTTILITFSMTPPRTVYKIERNSGFLSALKFVEKNTVIGASMLERKGAICGWLTRYQGHFRYKGDTPPLGQWDAIHLLDAAIEFDRRSAPVVSTLSTGDIPSYSTGYAKLEKSKVVKAKLVQRQAKFGRRTRSSCFQLSKYLVSNSRSKNPMQYTGDVRRHLIGQSPKVKRPLSWSILKMGKESCIQIEEKQRRIGIITELEAVHSGLIHLGILAPRDRWEEWIENFKSDSDCDPAFMCLLIILMSANTSDNQLAQIVPRLFCSGITSAKAVLDIAQTYGQDSFCSLLSECGRYYQNTERILNAADYFVQRHSGPIPQNISIEELCSLYGVGYKTANIVLTTAFRRVEGIPSDIHVIRWSALLGWCPSTVDGFKCSKIIESWLPKDMWESINPLFGSFGQLLVSDQRKELLEIVQQHHLPFIRQLFASAASMYSR
jgi:endonuclease III